MMGDWLLWNANDTDIEILNVEDQVIHSLITRKDKASWVVSGIFAQLDKQIRLGFLIAFSSLVDLWDCHG